MASSQSENPEPAATLTARRKMTYMPTTAAYDRWAQVYDTDANPLQALDDHELTTLLPDFLALVEPQKQTGLRITDLGCGTGRNTLKLLAIPDAEIAGLDASEKMLEKARSRCRICLDSLPSGTKAKSIFLEQFDMLSHDEAPQCARNATAVISTLVLEHIPLPAFFSVAQSLLIDGGHLLLTNMHAEMGSISQAGFVDPESGEKLRPVSYAHKIEDVVAEARRCGFDVVGDVKEVAIEAELVEKFGKRAQKWVGVKCWFGVVFRKG